MNAWVLHGIDDFRYEQVNKPELKEDEVLVEVRAVGICG
jgi:L-iditol 2-dehydrogenase